MKTGLYVGPAGQIIEIIYTDGPGFNTGSLMVSTDGNCFFGIYPYILTILEGYEFLCV